MCGAASKVGCVSVSSDGKDLHLNQQQTLILFLVVFLPPVSSKVDSSSLCSALCEGD